MRRVVTSALLASALAFGGCVSSDPGTPASGELAEGLTILRAEPGALTVAFRRDEQVVFAEALRGAATPEPYQSDELSPRFQMDARFTAGDGYTFFTHQGDDVWLDPTWADDRDRQSALPPVDGSNEWMFELATELADALPAALEEHLGPDGAAALAPELRVVLETGRNAHRTYRDGVRELRDQRLREQQMIIEGTRTGDVAYGDVGGPDEAWRALPANYYYFAHYVGDISFAWLCGGYHSATRIYEWRSGAWASVHENANHGRGPGDSSMRLNAILQYYEPIGDYHPAWTVRTCGTGYDALSNGGGHNCHDDARIQGNNFVFNSTLSGSQYWCGDGDSSADYSCGTEGGHPYGSGSVNSRGRNGYNHPWRCQYNMSSSCPASYQGTGDGCDCGCVFPDGTGADPDCTY